MEIEWAQESTYIAKTWIRSLKNTSPPLSLSNYVACSVHTKMRNKNHATPVASPQHLPPISSKLPSISPPHLSPQAFRTEP